MRARSRTARSGTARRPPPDGRPWSLAFAPAGGRLAVTLLGRRAGFEVVDTAARPPRVVAAWAVHGAMTAVPVWSADGRVVAVRGPGGGVRAFDAATGRELSPPSTAASSAVTALAASADGSSAVVGDVVGQVRRWDLTTGRLLAEASDPPGAADDDRLSAGIEGLAYGPATGGRVGDGPLVATTMLGAWRLDPTTLVTAGRLEARRPYTGRTDVYSADGRLVARFAGSFVTVADVATGRTVAATPDVNTLAGGGSDGGADGVAFTADGRRLLVQTYGGFRLLDVAGGRAGPLVRPAEGTRWAVISPDGRWVAINSGTDGQTVGLYSADAAMATEAAAGPLRPVWTVRTPGIGGHHMAFTGAGEWLAVPTVPWGTVGVAGVPASQVAVYEAATGRPVLFLPTSGSEVLARFVPARPLAITTEPDGTALVWDLRAAVRLSGPAMDPGRSDGQLWADLADPDPAVAYQAGFALLDRGHLAGRAGADGGDRADWRRWIADLSSPDHAKREAAHRRPGVGRVGRGRRGAGGVRPSPPRRGRGTVGRSGQAGRRSGEGGWRAGRRRRPAAAGVATAPVVRPAGHAAVTRAREVTWIARSSSPSA